jgi:hypothetical protein
MMRFAIVALATGCGALGTPSGDAPPGDAACRIAISISSTSDPNPPVASPATTVRATAVVGDIGIAPQFNWAVSLNANPVTFTLSPDKSEIDFQVPVAGTYHVTLEVPNAVQCDPPLPADVNVHAPGAHEADYLVRIAPPATTAVPAQQIALHVYGGVNAIIPQQNLSSGATFEGATAPATPAYIRFSPPGSPVALTEVFTNNFGGYNVRLLGVAYDALVIPTSGSAPGERITAWMPGPTLPLDSPQTITGFVKNALNVGIPNVQVALTIDGAPTTVGTTRSDGSFSVLGYGNAQSSVDVTVTPLASTGLPRLIASGKFNPTQPITINYTAAVTVVSVAGVHVRRGGANVPNAPVTIFGTLAGAGLINATASATGEVRLSATANASGDLPAGTQVARGGLSGVLLAGGTLGVGAFDTTGAIPAAIDTSAPVASATVVRDPANVTLGGVAVDAVPAGALAAAGGAVVHGTTAVDGSVSLLLASGGHYTLRVSDPGARGAQGVAPDVVAGSLPPVMLGKAITISGIISDSTSSPIPNASVQILCYACTGIDASRPIAQSATSELGAFTVAIPDPGTM